MPQVLPFDPIVRAVKKQTSRDADVRAVASGEKSRAQLKVKNGTCVFPRDRIRIERSSKH